MAADLLELLDAFVKADPRPPGLCGEVVVGVDGARFWRGSFGAETKSELLNACPERRDAMLLLSSRDAHAILRGAPLSDTAHFLGERSLMKKFLDRYLAKRTA